LFSLGRLASVSLSSGIEGLTDIADALRLTESGEAACSVVNDRRAGEVDESQAKVGAFLALFWDDLYLDVEATDIEAIAAFMHGMVRERSLRYPWLYGRLVDEVYLARFGDFHYELDSADTAVVVGELPQGVWQLGPFVTGPYGLLRASEARWLMPRRIGPVLGCTDPGCDALHGVLFNHPYAQTRVNRAILGCTQRQVVVVSGEPASRTTVGRPLPVHS
jgi:hypothetical protein